MKKGEKVLLILGALLIAAGVFVGVTLGWDYSPNNYAYNEIEFTTADTETGECSFVSVQLSDLEVNIYSTTDKTVSIAARGAKTPDRVSVVLDGGVRRITEKKPGLFQRLAEQVDVVGGSALPSRAMMRSSSAVRKNGSARWTRQRSPAMYM